MKTIIIDEISMVSNDLFFPYSPLIAGNFWLPKQYSVIAVGDFLQLPPVRVKLVYAEYNDGWQNLVSLWILFEIKELK